MTSLKRTPLYETHRRHGARMIEFGGFELPVQYTSIREEHFAVREAAGLFDTSHMGQIEFEGPDAIAAAGRLFSRNLAALAPGRVQYGLLCNENGGVVDDITCYREREDFAFWCVNAANIEKDHRWILDHAASAEGVRDASAETGLLALQGPASAAILARVGAADAAALRHFRFARTQVANCPAIVSRTGYTGGDGFEIYLDSDNLPQVFEALLGEGGPLGLVPAGLGARDTLRLEAALPLYGHELDEDTSPLAAGLGRFVDLEAGGFIGAEAIARARDAGLSQQLVGFALEERGVARAGCAVTLAGETIGRVTSGGPSPTLGKSIGLAYVSAGVTEPGSGFQVVVRDRALQARVVETPFV
ncbi:MAG: glycine cleavage system aminomethyltransferase GcvT [Deltaproteobacteria bacterium]|jgi:aminomethyltransferase|nr:glycine cleavage system aminomethyltransferase GcvT [Deltaproteobacteria bacterium]MBW2542923.1 glycine cleavage system aminomethyltransferase GcvT [Deltaproteobacteria bacterium]